MDAETKKRLEEIGEGIDRLKGMAALMLMALDRVGCQDAGSCSPDAPDGQCFVCETIALANLLGVERL